MGTNEFEFGGLPGWVGYLLKKLGILLGSRKFWISFFTVLISYNIPIKPELQALILLIVSVVFVGTTAWEDVANGS